MDTRPTLSDQAREALASVVVALGGGEQAAAIRAGADLILADLATALGVPHGELADAWTIEFHERTGLILAFDSGGTIYAVKRRKSLH